MNPTDPQPVPDAYRCGDLDPAEWEVWCAIQEVWRPPSIFPAWAIRPARRKQAPPLTPREGDTVEHDTMQFTGQVVYTSGDEAAVDTDCGLVVVWSVAHLTVTDRPPRRPVRVWLTDEQVERWATPAYVTPGSTFASVADACRALVGGEG